MAKILSRFLPLLTKLSSRAPLCPWSSATSMLGMSTIRIYPPVKCIRTLHSQKNRKLMEFDGFHRFWFPEGMEESQELWSEYLVAFWDHPMNFHRYLRGGVQLQKTDIVIDCGACEGFFTRAALDSGVTRVICVEPSPVMAECLRMTFEAEIAADRVLVMQAALGSFPGSARFSCADGDAFSGHFNEDGTETVDVITLDQITAKYGCPSFIKMDLEGFEYQALAGGLDTLSENHPKLGITTYHNPWDYAVISSFLKGAGYQNANPYGVSMRGGTYPRPVMVHAW